MNIFLEPFWYIEYEKIHFQYYTKLNDFKNYAKNEYNEEKRKRESVNLNILHKHLNSIRYQFKIYFCTDYKNFEKSFDLPIKHKYQGPVIPIFNDDNEEEEEEEEMKINLTRL